MNNKKKWIIIASSGVVLVFLILLVFLPLYHLYQGNSAFKMKEYDIAVQEYKMSLGYGNATEKIRASYYEKGKYYLSVKNEKRAIEDFKNSNNYKDSNQLLEDIALNLIKDENYYLAIEAYEAMSSEKEKPEYYYYALGCDALIKKKDYQKAIDMFNSCSDIDGVGEKIKESYYLLGKKNIETNEYDSAKENFSKAGDYSDSAYMINVCDFLKAEEFWDNGTYGSAVEIYEKLPQDFSYGEVDVANRINSYNNYNNLTELIGHYKVTSSDFHVKEIHGSTGIWNGWDNDGFGGEFEIEVDINNDGTINVSGRAEGQRFANYSSISSALDYTTFSISFSENTSSGTLRQGVLNSNDTTTLTYLGNNTFSLSYYEVDNTQNVYFNYEYTSNYVFTKQ